MSVSVLKEKIHNTVERLNDEKVLADILRVIELESSTGALLFNENQKKELSKACDEVDQGETRTNESVVKEMEEWLSK